LYNLHIHLILLCNSHEYGWQLGMQLIHMTHFFNRRTQLVHRRTRNSRTSWFYCTGIWTLI